MLALVLVLSACSGGKDKESQAPAGQPSATPTATPTPTPLPSRDLVVWADTVCAAVDELASERESLAKLNQDVNDPTFGPMSADSYLGGKSSAMTSLADTFAELKPSGNAAADKLVAEYKRGLAAIAPKIEALAGFGSYYDISFAEKVRRARQVGALIATVKPTSPALPALAKADPLLGSAYHLAPRCVPPTPATPSPGSSTTPSKPPTTPLPAAADGENYQACADGNCEVLVKKSAQITVKNKLLTVTVTNGVVSVSNREADGSGFSTGLSEEGGASWGTKDSMTEGKLSGLNATAAVVKFTSK